MNKLDIQEILSRPLKKKIQDMLTGINGNIECILKESEDCNNPIEYARFNGQVYAFSVAKGMIESILRLEKSEGISFSE